MMTYDEYMGSTEWSARARLARRRAGYRCMLCYRRAPLEVHHRTYERLGNEKDTDVIALCAECHARHHDRLDEMLCNSQQPYLPFVAVMPTDIDLN